MGTSSFHEQILRRGGRRYLAVISNDNNDEDPQFIIKVWDITNDTHIRCWNDLARNAPTAFGPALPGMLNWDPYTEKMSDGVPYPTMEAAKKGLVRFMIQFGGSR